MPQVPLQPSSPHSLEEQSGSQVTQAPSSLQIVPGSQLPQLPLQPSSPQTLSAQSGTQPVLGLPHSNVRARPIQGVERALAGRRRSGWDEDVATTAGRWQHVGDDE